MTQDSCWRLSVYTIPEAEEAASQLLERIFNHPAVAYRKEESRVVQVSVFLTRNPRSMDTAMRSLRSELGELVRAGFFSQKGRITVKRLKSQDWAESWKRHFKCIEVSSQLLIRPSWSRRKPKKGQSVITLDPGLSFGTGHHPTTAFCLRQMVARRVLESSQSLLDIGTGSGILALAAARLGYHPIKAFDCDPAAVDIAISNARLNQVLDKIDFSVAMLESLSPKQSGRFDVVCANLEYPLIAAYARLLSELLLPRGCLLVAGILVDQFSSVVQALSRQGLRRIATEKGEQWQSGVFAF